jgi:DNA-binding LacI/PurR family transcriptional regulator
MAVQLLALVSGEEIEPIVTLPTELIVRESA